MDLSSIPGSGGYTLNWIWNQTPHTTHPSDHHTHTDRQDGHGQRSLQRSGTTQMGQQGPVSADMHRIRCGTRKRLEIPVSVPDLRRR